MEKKKELLLCILKILEEYSDEDHPLLNERIRELLFNVYHLSCDRRTVTSCLQTLEDLGYDIQIKRRVGVYLGERLFDKTEISFIIDALLSSKSIESKRTKQLAERVTSCLSKYERQSYAYIHKSSEINKTHNLSVFSNIDCINEAIKKKKKITCKYLTYDNKGNKKYRFNDNYRYHIDPYFLINNQGRYYLLCHASKKYNDVSCFRVDYLEQIDISDENRIEMKDLNPKYENFSISTYINDHIYLFGGDVIIAKLLLDNSDSIKYIIDWFGKNAKIINDGDQIIALVKSNEKALYYWLMQYNEHIKVLSPENLVNKIKSSAEDILKKYQ